MNSVTVKILRPVSAGAAGSFSPGQIVSLPADHAAALIGVRKAEVVVAVEVAPSVEAAPPVVETTATAPAVETAAATPPPARRKLARK